MPILLYFWCLPCNENNLRIQRTHKLVACLGEGSWRQQRSQNLHRKGREERFCFQRSLGSFCLNIFQHASTHEIMEMKSYTNMLSVNPGTCPQRMSAMKLPGLILGYLLLLRSSLFHSCRVRAWQFCQLLPTQEIMAIWVILLFWLVLVRISLPSIR